MPEISKLLAFAGRGGEQGKTGALGEDAGEAEAGDRGWRKSALGWNPDEPWNTIWNMVLDDAEFWQEQVHVPALSWMARGSKGIQKTPAEEIAAAAIGGGASRFHAGEEGGKEDLSPIKNPNRVRREAKKKKWQAEKEELRQYRILKGSGKGGGNPEMGASRPVPGKKSAMPGTTETGHARTSLQENLAKERRRGSTDAPFAKARAILQENAPTRRSEVECDFVDLVVGQRRCKQRRRSGA